MILYITQIPHLVVEASPKTRDNAMQSGATCPPRSWHPCWSPVDGPQEEHCGEHPGLGAPEDCGRAGATKRQQREAAPVS